MRIGPAPAFLSRRGRSTPRMCPRPTSVARDDRPPPRWGGRAGIALLLVGLGVLDTVTGHEYGEPVHQVVDAIVQLLTFAFLAVLLVRTSRGLRIERKLSAHLTEEEERVERLDAGDARLLTEAILADVSAFSQGVPFEDDGTLLVVHRTPS